MTSAGENTVGGVSGGDYSRPLPEPTKREDRTAGDDYYLPPVVSLRPRPTGEENNTVPARGKKESCDPSRKGPPASVWETVVNFFRNLFS